MLIFNKTKLLIALGAVIGGSLLVSLLSDETNEYPLIVESGGKLDFIADNLCKDKDGNFVSYGTYDYVKLRKRPEDITLKIGDKEFNFNTLRLFSSVDLSNKEDIYKSRAWNIFVDKFSLNDFDVEEIKRKNQLPDDFIKVVEYGKSHMEKLYDLEEISLKNLIVDSNSYYDFKNERLEIFLATSMKEDFFEGRIIGDKSLFIDVPFDEMKKITTDLYPSAYTFHLLLERVEKGKVTNDKVVKSSYIVKSISPEINVIKDNISFKDAYLKLKEECGVYHNNYPEDLDAPISKGILGTIKVKNPRLCTGEYTQCKELTISDSF